TALEDYARLIRSEPPEAAALLRELLISVTHFFRDREAWAALEQRVIPRLFEGKESHDQVRVWVVGCATGEEGYSVAMLLSEAASNILSAPSLQVFASDLDEQAIATAREAWYSTSDAADIPEARLRRFFRVDGEGYSVRRELRELVLFAHHNVIR